MDGTNKSGQDTYRLLITRRHASEILVVANRPDWSLPRTQIPSQQRPAEHLTAATRKSLELETCCLFLPGSPSSVRAGQNACCAVLEAVRQSGPAPSGTCWMPASIFD